MLRNHRKKMLNSMTSNSVTTGYSNETQTMVEANVHKGVVFQHDLREQNTANNVHVYQYERGK